MAQPNSQTALQIVTDAYRAIRVLGDQDPALDQIKSDYGFSELQGMMDQWRLEGWLTDNANGQVNFTLIPGQDTYFVGPTGPDIVTPIPPAWIEYMFVTDNLTGSGGVGRTFPISLCAPEEFWRAGRATNTTTPYSMYATYLTDFPTASIKFYPIPAIGIQCTVVYPEHIAIPNTLNDTLTLSPGFRNAMVYSLANILTVAYPTDATGQVATMAAKYMDRIKEARRKPNPSALLDPAVSQSGTGGRMRTSRQGLYDICSNAFVGSL